MRFNYGGPKRYAHQVKGLRKIIENRGVAALLFDPGTGKTATALDYSSILALKSPGQEARVLVIAPNVAIDTWVLQAANYVSPDVNVWAEALGGSVMERAAALAARGGSPFPLKRGERPRRPRGLGPMHPTALNVDRALAWYASGDVRREEGPRAVEGPRLVLLSMSLETFSSRQPVGSRTMADHLLEAVGRFAPDLVIVDESHKIKGASSNVSRLLARIGTRVPRRLILTGTVMPHSPLDVFGQWRFLDPTAFGPGGGRAATWTAFQQRYARLGGYMGRQVVGYRNLDEMQSIMARRAEVAKKEDALDLPPTTSVEIPVHLSAAELRAYEEMKTTLATRLAGGQITAANRLAQMMRLRQITSGHLPDDSGSIREIGTSKVDTITSLVHDTLAGEKRIVVFSVFSHEIEALSRSIAQKGTTVLKIDGSTPKADRLAYRKRFGSDDPERLVIVAQIATLSLAVNELVTASHAVFGSLTQQRADFIQAQDRLNRAGQERPVTFWFAVAPRTVDTLTLSAHQRRTDIEESMLRHILDDDPDTLEALTR